MNIWQEIWSRMVCEGAWLNPRWTLVFRLNIPKELCQLFFCQLNLFLLCSFFFATTLSHECETSKARYHHKPRTRHSANILQSCSSPAQRSLQWIRGRLTFNYQVKKRGVHTLGEMRVILMRAKQELNKPAPRSQTFGLQLQGRFWGLNEVYEYLRKIPVRLNDCVQEEKKVLRMWISKEIR